MPMYSIKITYMYCITLSFFIQLYLDISMKSYYNPWYDFVLIEVIYDKLFRR